MDVVLHPKFAENKLVYLNMKPLGNRRATMAVGRGRYVETLGIQIHRPDFEGIKIVVYQQNLRSGHVAHSKLSRRGDL